MLDFKNSFTHHLGSGWHPIELVNGVPFVWSQKEASLNFPVNENGYYLTLSSDPMNLVGRSISVKIFDADGNLLSEEIFGPPLKVVKIPSGIKRIKLAISQTWRPSQVLTDSQDNRQLGVCLYRIEDAACFDEKGEWKKHLLGEVCQWNPQILEIETTNYCNMNPPCVMCNRNARLKKHEKNMPDVLLNRLRKNIKGAHMISLHGTGEPLLDERIFDLLADIWPEVLTRFTTNGLLLDEKNCLKIIQSGLKEISVSLDAATPETYEKIRGPHFMAVKKNVRRLVALKKEKKSTWPEILINMALMKANIDEVPAFIDLAHKLGVNQVYFKLLSPASILYEVNRGDFIFKYADQFLNTASREFKKNIQAAFNKCQELKIKLICPDKEVWNAVAR